MNSLKRILVILSFSLALTSFELEAQDNPPPEEPECNSETETRTRATGEFKKVIYDTQTTHCPDGSVAKRWDYYNVHEYWVKEERTSYTGGNDCPAPTPWVEVERRLSPTIVRSGVDFSHLGCDSDRDDDDDGSGGGDDGGGGGQDCYPLVERNFTSSDYCETYYNTTVNESEPVDELPNPSGLNILYEGVGRWVPRPGFRPFNADDPFNTNYEYPENPEDTITYLKKTYTRSLAGSTECLDGSISGTRTEEFDPSTFQICFSSSGFNYYLPDADYCETVNPGETTSDQLTRWSISRCFYDDEQEHLDIKYQDILSNAYTNSSFKQDIQSAFSFSNVYSRATSYLEGFSSIASLITHHGHIYYGKTKFKFKWGGNVAPEDRYPVEYIVLFIPKSDNDPSNGDESEMVEVVSSVSVSWNGQSAESGSFEIDPLSIDAGKEGSYRLLKVDLDVVHPATDELNEAKEDVDDGGYVSIKREVDGDDVAPVTQLKLHANSSLPSTAKFRLKFADGGRYKIYSDVGRATEVVSEQTEFAANVDTTLYFQGLGKSQSRGGEEVMMQIGVGGNWYDGDSVKCTVIQSEFEIVHRVFIPYNWVDIPWHPFHADDVAEGDDRDFDPTLAGTYRVEQKVVINPYKDLVSNRIRSKSIIPGETKHFDEDDVVNFDEDAKHSDLTAVQPSYIPHGAIVHNSGFADITEVTITLLNYLTNDKQTIVELKGSASEPIVFLAAPIDWQFNVGVEIDDPLNPTAVFSGLHDGFPAYEIYINANHPIFPVTEVLKWAPSIDKGVLELVGGANVPAGSGIRINIEQ